MQVEAKIKVLVTIFDHSLANIPLAVPESVRDIRLLQSTVEKYSPDFFERCQTVAYSLLYLNFKERVPEATKELFVTKFMSTQLGVDSFKETLEYVSGVLPKVVTVEQLRGVLDSVGGGVSGESKK